MDVEISGLPSGDPRVALLRSMFESAVAAAHPRFCLADQLPDPAQGRALVLAVGKAAHEMARVVEESWLDLVGPARLYGVATAPPGSVIATRAIAAVYAAHPVPDDRSRLAGERALLSPAGLTERDLVLCLISGGASSLWTVPVPPVTLEMKSDVTRALLRSGAPIGEMNVVRKHLSRIKGGRLAVAAGPARVETLAISDIPGDDPENIGSGPTVGDPSTQAEALDIMRRYDVATTPEIEAVLSDPVHETPKPDNPTFRDSRFTIVANGDTALTAAAKVAEKQGLAVVNLGSAVDGEARDVARAHAEKVAVLRQNRAVPWVLLSGGETSVTVTGSGRGGRNTEYLLAFREALADRNGVYAMACDTDGIDGVTDAAGAMMTPETTDSGAAYLDANDSYGFFERTGGLVRCGPTGTNVNDLRAILVT
ncbi:MAG: glycerate kinase [Alphaproteobacteria bacterium]|nr:glycerate kinase [Alphaproteobacteria bacterium]